MAECPSLQDKPFYIDRSAGAAGFKFGDVARMKCPNKILEGTDKSLLHADIGNFQLLRGEIVTVSMR